MGGEFISKMLSHGASSFTHTLNRSSRCLVTAIVAATLAVTAAHADPRIDLETAAALPTAAVSPAAGAQNAPDRVCSAAKLQQRGVASWYGRHWRGRKTASGQRYDERLLTAASLSLPLATRARVTNLRNGRSVDVVVNDRGPYIGGRIIDLSERAAAMLGMTRAGLARVAVTALPAPALPARGTPST